MSFEEELTLLIEDARATGMPHEQLAAAVVELHHKHGREVPPPITGTVAIAEPDDSFG